MASNVQGALWMLASAFCFTLMTTLVKYLGSDYPAPLQAFYRNAAGFAILLPVILTRGRRAFSTTRPGILFFRSGVGTLGIMLSFYAFQKMPLADGNALSFTRTLWMVPLAVFVVREKVGLLRVAAAILGFLGVITMLHPSAGRHLAVDLPALAMLASAFLLALSVAGMKVMMRDHAPIVLLVWAATLGFVFAIPGAILTWRWPHPVDFGLLCLMGVIATANQALYIKGMQMGDAAAMAPIDYSRLVFGVIAGFLLFHQLPGVWALAGAGIVVASTLLITLRELQVARATRRQNAKLEARPARFPAADVGLDRPGPSPR